MGVMKPQEWITTQSGKQNKGHEQQNHGQNQDDDNQIRQDAKDVGEHAGAKKATEETDRPNTTETGHKPQVHDAQSLQDSPSKTEQSNKDEKLEEPPRITQPQAPASNNYSSEPNTAEQAGNDDNSAKLSTSKQTESNEERARPGSEQTASSDKTTKPETPSQEAPEESSTNTGTQEDTGQATGSKDKGNEEDDTTNSKGKGVITTVLPQCKRSRKGIGEGAALLMEDEKRNRYAIKTTVGKMAGEFYVITYYGETDWDESHNTQAIRATNPQPATEDQKKIPLAGCAFNHDRKQTCYTKGCVFKHNEHGTAPPNEQGDKETMERWREMWNDPPRTEKDDTTKTWRAKADNKNARQTRDSNDITTRKGQTWEQDVGRG